MKSIKTKKIFAMLLSLFIVMMSLPISAFADVVGEISLETTLTDGITLKGSKKTFDVIARLEGEKISSEVTLNGEEVKYNWDDNNKTSYTLNFKEEGKNNVVVKAYSRDKVATKSYSIVYEKASKGDLIGHATWTVEALTIGRGFIVEPTQFPIYEGENAAQSLDRILTEKGYSYNRTGKLGASFYLSIIGDGGKLKYGCKDKDKMQTLNAPIDIKEKVPQKLKEVLERENNWPTENLDDASCLGEFDYTFMSGWMYAVNNIFPNVGFADSYLGDGDVVRVQFTLFGYGGDIGGSYAMGGQSTDYYEVANKDKLMALLSSINSSKDKDKILDKSWIKKAYDEAMKVAIQLDETQITVDEVYSKLNFALERIPLTSIYLDKTSVTLDKNTEETLVVGYNEQNTTDNKTVEWTTSDETVATVENGKVTTLKEGKAIITARVGTLTATCEIIVPEFSIKPIRDEDKATGVNIEAPANILPVDTKLIVIPITESSVKVFKGIETSLKDISEKFSAFDIHLESEGVKVEPKGNVKVILPIPTGYDHSKILIYRILEDGTFKDMQAIITDDSVSFETNHFSVYVISEKRVMVESPVEPVEPMDPKEPIKEGDKEETPISKEDIPVSKEETPVSKEDIPVSKEEMPISKGNIPDIKEKTSINEEDTTVSGEEISNDILKTSSDNEDISNEVNTTKVSKQLDGKASPKTGDNSPIIFITLLFFVSFAILVALVYSKKKGEGIK